MCWLLALLLACADPAALSDGLQPGVFAPPATDSLNLSGARPDAPPAAGPVVVTVEGHTLPADLEEADAVDLIIVGAGPAGLAAAQEAEAAGLDWRIVEKADAVGGALRYRSTSPLLFFAGSEAQAVAGIEDDAATLLAEWPAPESPWLVAWASDMIPMVYDWLEGRGLRFTLAATSPDVGSRPRAHEISGSADALARALSGGLADDAILLNTALTGLLVEDGVVVGVDTTMGPLRAGAVLLATGGFQRDPDLVARARPDLDGLRVWQASWPAARGDGHRLIERVGGTLQNLGAIGIYAHGSPDVRDPDGDEELTVSTLSLGTWLDAAGERLDPHGAIAFDAGDLVVEHGAVWSILDADLARSTGLSDPMRIPGEGAIPSFAEALDLGAPSLVSSADPAALAAATGIDEEALRGTLTGEPPWVAVRVAPTLAKVFGGAWVGLDGAVLRANGDPLPGLYAAGELTGMIGGGVVGPDGHGFSGSLSAVIYGGRMAARGAIAALPR